MTTSVARKKRGKRAIIHLNTLNASRELSWHVPYNEKGASRKYKRAVAQMAGSIRGVG